MNILRKVKLSEIVDVKFTPEELDLVNSINTNLSNLILYKYKDYPERDFYINKDSNLCVLEHHKVTDIIYVNVNILTIINTDLIEYFIKKKCNIPHIFYIQYFESEKQFFNKKCKLII